jgi:hypothetical protein
MDSMRSSDKWNPYVNIGGLFIHDVDARQVGRFEFREEAFMSSLAGKVPWVRASERAYGTYLNKLRFDVMDDMVRKYEGALGRKLNLDAYGNTVNVTDESLSDIEVLQDLAKYVNAVTGRGPIPKGDSSFMRGATTIMNALLFSPRLLTSRIAAPAYAIKNMRGAAGEISNSLYPAAVGGDPQARAAYKAMSSIVAQQMASWLGGGIAILTGLKILEETTDVPITVGIDPRSTDFGKVRVGNSRYDIWSGYSQIARTMFQLATGETVSAQTGRTYPKERAEIVKSFIQSKFAPQVSVVTDYNLTGLTGDQFGTGTGFLGEDRDIVADMKNVKGFVTADEESFWTRIMTPLFIRNLADTVQEGMTPIHIGNVNNQASINEKPSLLLEVAKALPAAGAEFLGMGVTTYGTRDDISREMTADRPGGPVGYAQLQRYEQRMVDEAFDERTASMGRTFTQGWRGEIEALEEQESLAMQNLVNQIGVLSNSEIIDDFFSQRNNFRIRKNQLFESQFGDSAEERRRYKVEALGPVGLLLEEFSVAVDKAKEAKGGGDLTSSEYSDVLSVWERDMINNRGANGTAAVIGKRMNAYLVDIPPELLRILPSSIRSRYLAARQLRAEHGAGMLRSELYGE